MHWIVETPEYEYEEWTDGWILADRYNACDMTSVEAETKREAIIKGVKKLREKRSIFKDYYNWYWDKSTNPYTGVIAEDARCEHGFCRCGDFDGFKHEDQDDYCEECDKQIDEAYQQEIARNESSNTG